MKAPLKSCFKLAGGKHCDEMDITNSAKWQIREMLMAGGWRVCWVSYSFPKTALPQTTEAMVQLAKKIYDLPNRRLFQRYHSAITKSAVFHKSTLMAGICGRRILTCKVAEWCYLYFY